MKTRIYLLCLALLLGAAPSTSRAFNKGGRASFQFLKIGIGAHQTAVGEVAVATFRDVNGVFWNPALITGVQKSKYMCMPCSMEYHRFLQQQLSPDASNLAQQEQLDVIRKLLDEAEAHMKQWVASRRGGLGL